MEHLSFLKWLIFTLVAISFSMASVTEETMLRYVYFAISVVSCYAIRKTGGGNNPKSER